jgi:hypothetical protein
MNVYKSALLSLAVWANLFASPISVTTDVTTNTTWDADTVFIDKEYFEVKDGARLTIAAGTHVIFNKAISMITVRGTVTAIGTPADSIFISRMNPNDIWIGIRFVSRNRPINNRDSSFITYCNLRNAYYFVTDTLYQREGGILYCGSGNAVSLMHCSVTNVQGDIGGAVYCDSGSSVIIDRCYFGNNRTQMNGLVSGGGAIMTSGKGGAQLLLKDCRFERNCSRNGGALRIGRGTKAEVNNCIFYRDSTYSINPSARQLSGGAVAIFGPADVTLRNCMIFYCSSYSKGGGIYSSDAQVKLINCTIANNTSMYGGGIYFARDSAASSPLLVNTIDGGNGTSSNLPRDSAGCGIFLDSSVSPVFRYCQLYDTVHDFKIRPYTANLFNSRYFETEFVNWIGGFRISDTVVEGYQLYSRFNKNDPAIDGGTPDTTGFGLPEFDVLGQKRIYGSAVDIGAIEYLDQYIPVKKFHSNGKNSFSFGDSYSAIVYSLDGRQLGKFAGNGIPRTISKIMGSRVPQGIYLAVLKYPGRQPRLEKVLVK